MTHHSKHLRETQTGYQVPVTVGYPPPPPRKWVLFSTDYRQRMEGMDGDDQACSTQRAAVPDLAAGTLPMEAGSSTVPGPMTGMEIDGGAVWCVLRAWAVSGTSFHQMLIQICNFLSSFH